MGMFKKLLIRPNGKQMTSIQSSAVRKCNVPRNVEHSRRMSMRISNYSTLAVPLSYDVFLPETQPVSNVPIVILHALLSSKQQWTDFGKTIAIESNMKVYTLDARNHGDSPHTDDCGYSLMSEDLKRFMNSQSIPEAVLIGHSMGGRTAMLLALTNESFVKKLVVVDVSPLKLPPQALFVRDYMKAMKEASTSIPNISLEQGRAAVDAYLHKTIPKPSIREFLLDNLTVRNGTLDWKPNINVLLEMFNTNAVEFPAITGCYPGDTLFVCGGNSEFVSPEDYPCIQILFPKSKFVSIPNAEHWIHKEKPVELVQTVCSFL